MKRSAIIGLAVGIIFVLLGSVFALQGDGVLGGSGMSNNPFWLYAGSVIAVLGVAIAGLAVWMGSRSPPAKAAAG